MKKIIVLFVCIFSLMLQVRSQGKAQIDTAISFPFIKLGFGFQFPGGDMKDRFGNNSNLEGGFIYKHKSNFFIDAQVNFMFGNNVKEDTILDELLTETGNIIDNGGALGSLFFDERGFAIFGSIGKIIPILGPNQNSGITIAAGAGFLQHKIRIEYRDSKIPPLENGYSNGYDRLSNGFALRGYVGYTYFARKRLINFFVGFDFMQAWTVNRRGYNYDSGSFDNAIRNDRLSGIKFGWTLPLYKGKPDEFYLY